MMQFLREAGPLIFPVVLLVLVIATLAIKNGLALTVAIGIGVFVGVGYAVLESSLFDLRRRRRHK